MTRARTSSIAVLSSLVTTVLAGPVVAGPERPVAPPPPDGTGVPVRPALADNRRIVGILEVRVDGVPEEAKETFQRRLEEQLDTKHYWLASRARMKQMMQRSTKWAEGCLVGPCITEARQHTGAELILLASLTGAGTSFGYVVTLVRTDNGRVWQQHSERCDVCTVNEAIDKATQATIVLLNELPDKLPEEREDHPESVALAVEPLKQQLATRERRSRRLGIALTTVGLAGVLGGVVMSALDADASYPLAIGVGGGALAASGVAVLTF